MPASESTALTGIAGKLITGYLMDRFDAATINSLSIGIAVFAFIMLLEPFLSPMLIVIAMEIIGYASGCKLHISSYLTSRYSGMRNFGKVFGLMNSLIAWVQVLGQYWRDSFMTPMAVTRR